MPKWLEKFLEATVIFSYTRWGFSIRKGRWNRDDLSVDLSNQAIMVTGANAGLGFETSRQLAQLGATVHMIARNQKRGEAAQAELKSLTGNENIHLHVIDMSLMSDINRFSEIFLSEHGKLDVLINNAGAMFNERQVTSEGIEMSFATNLLGSFLLTKHMTPLLEKSDSGRIVFVSSGGMYTQMLNVNDLQSDRPPYKPATAYAQAKRAQVVLTEILAEKLQPKSIAVNSMHPGWVDTAALKNGIPLFYCLMKFGLRNLEQGADTIVWLAVSEMGGLETGKFWFDRMARPIYPFKNTENTQEDIDKFWNRCLRLSGLSK